ncbi:MAG: class I SAM-dependent methyltransferase [bacterium]
MPRREPIALKGYEKLAERYAAMIDTKPHNAYYERPAMLSLLPKVRGNRVLDAGCGPGAYAQILVRRGAEVVGVDISPKMLRLARERVGDKVEFHQADLTKPMKFLKGSSFDVVISPLVIPYIRDLNRLFKDFYRVLRSPGVLVFSDGHPFGDYLFFKRKRKSKNYFKTELVGLTWRGFGIRVYIPGYRRPLNALLNPLVAAGFKLDRIVEPLPTEEFKKADPKNYRKLMRMPGFICIRARKE